MHACMCICTQNEKLNGTDFAVDSAVASSREPRLSAVPQDWRRLASPEWSITTAVDMAVGSHAVTNEKRQSVNSSTQPIFFSVPNVNIKRKVWPLADIYI